MPTVILGGGIIGLSTAYYLSQKLKDESKVDQIYVVDSAPSLLLSASGYAGGFLAKDWFSPAVASLGALSFRLHRELADQHDGYRKWGYATSTAYSLAIDGTGVAGKRSRKTTSGEGWMLEGSSRAEVAQSVESSKTIPGDDNEIALHKNEMLNADGTPAWITQQEGGSLDVISSEDGCAQVEPRELCEWLIQQCEDAGVRFDLDSKVLGVINGNDQKVKGIRYKRHASTESEEESIQANNIVITAGAWSPRVYQTLFPKSRAKIRIKPLAGYSIVIRSPRYSRPIVDPSRHGKDGLTGMCHSVFCAPGPEWTYAPEAISRMTRDGRPEIYVAGLNDPDMSLPEDVTKVKNAMDKSKMRDLRRTTTLLTGLSKEGDELVNNDLEIVREGLCLRPVSSTNRPIIAKLTDQILSAECESSGGVYVAAGHGPWGISLGLGTGLVVAEMISGLNPSANIGGLGI